MTKLTRKNEKLLWTEDCERSFKELKKRLVTTHVLTVPSGDTRFVIYSDASLKGLGCALMQHGKRDLNMRHRRWLELLKDCDCNNNYHSGKANVVADALSRKSSSGIEMVMDTQARLSSLTLGSSLIDQIKAAQTEDSNLVKIKGEVQEDKMPGFTTSWDRTLRFKGRICVPNVKEIREVKVEHQRPSGLLHPLPIPVWRWDEIGMDFVSGFPKAPRGQDVGYQESIHASPYEVLYGCKCWSPLYWDEVGERRILEHEIIHDMHEKIAVIRKKLVIAQEQQRKNVNQRRRE
ncbi:hypothetical protein F2P56_035532, partial [Juglans regia]